MSHFLDYYLVFPIKFMLLSYFQNEIHFVLFMVWRLILFLHVYQSFAIFLLLVYIYSVKN